MIFLYYVMFDKPFFFFFEKICEVE